MYVCMYVCLYVCIIDFVALSPICQTHFIALMFSVLIHYWPTLQHQNASVSLSKGRLSIPL